MKTSGSGFNNDANCRTAVAPEAVRIFDDGYLARLRNGDEETAKHFDRYFRRLLRMKLWGKFTRERADDLIDNVMTAALDKILKGEPRDATRLAAYVGGICINLMRHSLRPSFNTGGVDPDQLQLVDRADNAEQRLLKQERAEKMRTALNSLGERDRAVLVDLFYHETERDEVCRKHCVNRQTLRSIVFRARQRFQSCWQG